VVEDVQLEVQVNELFAVELVVRALISSRSRFTSSWMLTAS
jgi:hypothetical protein